MAFIQKYSKDKALKIKAKKLVVRAMKDEAEKEIENLGRNSNSICKFVKIYAERQKRC